MTLSLGITTYPIVRLSVAGLQEVDQGLPTVASTLHLLMVPWSKSPVGTSTELAVRIDLTRPPRASMHMGAAARETYKTGAR